MPADVQSILRSGAALTDAALERLLPGATVEPCSIHRAMRHSTFAGGKRLRPIFVLEAARMTAIASTGSASPDSTLRGSTLPDSTLSDPASGGSARSLGGSDGLPPGSAALGAAIEMLHTYSLIHDDLPALDNDDLRRGQPTCHVVFGEAIAILAGDALQNLAFQTIGSLPAPAEAVVAVLREVSIAVGTGIGFIGDRDTGLPPGMIGGQVVDLESEGAKPSAALVEAIHRSKTGALITVSIVAGAIYGAGRRGLPARELALIRTFGEKAGLAFQIVDDILDVTQSSEQLGKTAGKDTATDKATWPAVFGIEQSRQDARQLIDDAFAALKPFGVAAEPLKAVARYFVDRTH